MCVDYRKLNSCIIPEVHPVPTYTLIADTFSYAKPKIYSSLDLRSSFHNLKIKKDSIKYTAFQTHTGQFEYLRCPFGIQNIPSALCCIMSLVLSENSGPLMKFALAYLDDVLIFSPCIHSHLDNLREIFLRLQKSKTKINPSKCSLRGHQSKNGVENRLIFKARSKAPKNESRNCFLIS